MKRAYDLREIAEYLDVQLRGDGQCQILSISSLETAREGDISFLANPAYKRYLQSSKASAVLLTEQDAAGYSGNVLLTNNPYVSYARVSRLFDRRYQVVAGVAAGASVANSARVGGTSQVAAGAVIDAGAVVGEGCHIGPGSYVGRDTVIGDGSYLHANVTVSDGISIGRRATIHSGAVIGADGFGFAPDGGGWVKIYQLGGVVIGDDVEIGAGTTIDRGALGNTIIGNGVKIDNLVQIAHNVQVGDNSALAGCAAIAGSSRIGRNCVLAGGAGLVGHITLCDNVTITGRSVITKSIDKPGIYSSGTPFEENRQWRKNAVRFGQLDTMAKRLSALEKQKKN